MKLKKYHIIGLGGTFDHFHAGHEKFLMFASDLSDILLIGVTNQSIAKEKTYSNSIEPYAERMHAVENFCRAHKIPHEIIELSDSVGSTTSDNRIEALAVTTETVVGGKKINQLRKKLGMTELPMHICALFLAEDNHPLHSERIRAGECDRKGFIYSDLFNQTITISEKQRLLLAQPQGKIVNQPSFLTQENAQPNPIILVGDSTIERFTTNKWTFHIGVFDRMIQRKLAQGITLYLKPDLVVQNPPGSITPELARSIQALLRSDLTKPKYLFIQGEEDLAAIPAILLSPLGSVTYYGQPKIGLVEIVSSENFKAQLLTHLV
ncbi:MAG TPA: pantetheine-phosphate adenylyltransferase [Candidatus Woesebacteria bacterium]|nr:pantetheine-phosphate adenylyltransferase [Candidatus Woesebacteria bacterium]